jgi:hypothetical protein
MHHSLSATEDTHNSLLSHQTNELHSGALTAQGKEPRESITGVSARLVILEDRIEVGEPSSDKEWVMSLG